MYNLRYRKDDTLTQKFYVHHKPELKTSEPRLSGNWDTLNNQREITRHGYVPRNGKALPVAFNPPIAMITYLVSGISCQPITAMEVA